MSTLPQRFKLLATRCAAGAPSPSRSPAPSYATTTSPGYRLRCRRGSGSRRGGGRLRRFLCRRVGGGPEPAVSQEEANRPLVGRGSRTLRDLFVASPEARRRRGGCGCEDEEEDVGTGSGREGMAHGGGAGGRTFRAGGLRSLLMRRSWRPVLVAIPESEGKIELGTLEEEQ